MAQLIPNTNTQSTNSVKLYLFSKTASGLVGKGGLIAAAHQISFSERRDVDEEWEINPLATGLPTEVIPQALTQRSITLNRYDLYLATLEQILGVKVADNQALSLANNCGPMRITVETTLPNIAQKSLVIYGGVYCTSIGRTLQVNGNTVIGAEAQFIWRTKMGQGQTG